MNRKLSLFVVLTLLANLAHPHDALALSVSPKCNGVSGEGQNSAFCSEAKIAKDAFGRNNSMGYVWSGVAAVCTVGAIFPATALACTGSSLGATGYQMIQTKNFSDAAVQVVTKIVNTQLTNAMIGVGSAAQKAGEAAAKKTAAARWGAALAAAMATKAAFDSFGGARGAKATLNSANAQIENLSNTNGTPPPTGETPNNPNGSNNPLTQNNTPVIPPYNGGGADGTDVIDFTGGTAQSPGGSGSSSGSGGGACGSVASAGDGASSMAMIECARMSDPALAELIPDPAAFNNAVQTATGKDLADLVRSTGGSPSAAAAAALANSGATGAQVANAKSALDDFVKHTEPGAPKMEGAQYADGGSGKGHKSGDANEPNPMDMIQQMLAQMGLGGEAPGAEKKGPELASSLNFGRGPASALNAASAASEISEDRQTSLFTRVSRRYALLGGRVSARPNLPVANLRDSR